MQQLQLHVTIPASTRQPGTKKQKATTEVDFEAVTKIQMRAFRKGAMSMVPPSHVHSGLGFHHWITMLDGKHAALTRKAAPTGVAITKAFAQGTL